MGESGIASKGTLMKESQEVSLKEQSREGRLDSGGRSKQDDHNISHAGTFRPLGLFLQDRSPQHLNVKRALRSVQQINALNLPYTEAAGHPSLHVPPGSGKVLSSVLSSRIQDSVIYLN